MDTTSWHGRWVASATAGWGVEDAVVFQGLVAEAREVVSRREFEAAARLVAATMLADVADALWRAVERLAGRVGRWGLCESVRMRVCLCVRLCVLCVFMCVPARLHESVFVCTDLCACVFVGRLLHMCWGACYCTCMRFVICFPPPGPLVSRLCSLLPVPWWPRRPESS